MVSLYITLYSKNWRQQNQKETFYSVLYGEGYVYVKVNLGCHFSGAVLFVF